MIVVAGVGAVEKVSLQTLRWLPRTLKMAG